MTARDYTGRRFRSTPSRVPARRHTMTPVLLFVRSRLRWARIASLPLLAALLPVAAVTDIQAQSDGGGAVYVVRVDGMIAPASADLVRRSLERARQQRAALVVLEMDTPGGLDTSMRAIIRDILASTVPVVTYVSPHGARAASAGTFILYASHVAAMAPATNVGAASPVAIGAPGGAPPPGLPSEPDKDTKAGGKDAKGGQGTRESRPRDVQHEKAENDAAAYLRSLAQLRGRNVDFAERAVRTAASIPAEDALRDGVIDLIATDVADLLRKLDGREVRIASGSVRLDLARSSVLTVEPDWRMRALAVLSNPTVAVLLLMIGIYGLFVEFTSPGWAVPGVGGAICLLLAMYALHLLPVNWAGVALLVLGISLMIAEVFLPSFGVIGVGGIVAFIVGGLMVIDVDLPGFGVSPAVVVALAACSAGAIAAVGTFAVRARRRPLASGAAELIGATGTVLASDAGNAWIEVRGERWRAASGTALVAGEAVRVVGIDGLLLDVQRVGPPAAAADPAGAPRAASTQAQGGVE
jgi:membrane-bound serine protease (ClpP class)